MEINLTKLTPKKALHFIIVIIVHVNIAKLWHFHVLSVEQCEASEVITRNASAKSVAIEYGATRRMMSLLRKSTKTKHTKPPRSFYFGLTRKYYESRNCKRELKYAINVCKPSKPIVFLMLEELELMKLHFYSGDNMCIQCYKARPYERVAREIFWWNLLGHQECNAGKGIYL